jgi:hypothetical protein
MRIITTNPLKLPQISFTDLPLLLPSRLKNSPECDPFTVWLTPVSRYYYFETFQKAPKNRLSNGTFN